MLYYTIHCYLVNKQIKTLLHGISKRHLSYPVGEDSTSSVCLLIKTMATTFFPITGGCSEGLGVL